MGTRQVALPVNQCIEVAQTLGLILMVLAKWKLTGKQHREQGQCSTPQNLNISVKLFHKLSKEHKVELPLNMTKQPCNAYMVQGHITLYTVKSLTKSVRKIQTYADHSFMAICRKLRKFTPQTFWHISTHGSHYYYTRHKFSAPLIPAGFPMSHKNILSNCSKSFHPAIPTRIERSSFSGFLVWPM